MLTVTQFQFGTLPKSLETKLATATVKEITSWIDLVFQASTIKDVTGGRTRRGGNRCKQSSLSFRFPAGFLRAGL